MLKHTNIWRPLTLRPHQPFTQSFQNHQSFAAELLSIIYSDVLKSLSFSSTLLTRWCLHGCHGEGHVSSCDLKGSGLWHHELCINISLSAEPDSP